MSKILDPTSSTYGEEKVKQILEKIERDKKRLAKKKPKPLTNKNPIAPKLNWNPMENNLIKMPEFELDWEDTITTPIATNLSNLFVNHPGIVGPGNTQILNLGTGIGKTAIAIKTVGLMQQEKKVKIPLMIVTTKNVCSELNWESTILSWNVNHPENTIEPILVTTSDKITMIGKHAKTLKDVTKALGSNGMLIVDEVHYFRNPASQRSKQLHKFKAFTKLGLTATLIGNDPIYNIASYLIMANYYNSKNDFSVQMDLKNPRFLMDYGKLNIYKNDGTIDSDRWPQYHDMMREFATILVSPKIDTTYLNMPKVNVHMHQLPFDVDTYLDVLSLKVEWDKRNFPTEQSYRMAILERIGNESNRMNKLLEIVSDESVIQPLIYYEHDNVRDAIFEVFNKHNISYQQINGAHEFKDIDKTSHVPIVIQYKSGGEGVSLKLSNCTIFYENQYACIPLEQARGRNKRRNSLNKFVDHHYIVSEHGIDKEIFTRVSNGENLSESIIKEIIDRQLGGDITGGD